MRSYSEMCALRAKTGKADWWLRVCLLAKCESLPWDFTLWARSPSAVWWLVISVCLCAFMVVDLDSQDGHLSSKIFIGDRTGQQPAVCCLRAQVFVCCQTFEGTCCQMTGEVGCPANLRLWQLLLRLPDVPIVLMLPLLFSHSQK